MTQVEIAAKLVALQKEREELKARFDAGMNEVTRNREILFATFNHGNGSIDGQEKLLKEMMEKG
ncbi:MAG: hypothetical protein Q8P41_31655 [Pseudomonadota bacterium]|nr:hypothetical protein [Pseudomonadota bacterium]